MKCKNCGSEDVRTHGKNRAICLDCNKTFTLQKKNNSLGIIAETKNDYAKKWHQEKKEERIEQYLTRQGRTREDYEENRTCDYDLGSLTLAISQEDQSLSALAKDIGVSYSTLYNLMHKPPRTMRIKKIRKFENFFKRKFRL